MQSLQLNLKEMMFLKTLKRNKEKYNNFKKSSHFHGKSRNNWCETGTGSVAPAVATDFD
jgi:hypothetical protein